MRQNNNTLPASFGLPTGCGFRCLGRVRGLCGLMAFAFLLFFLGAGQLAAAEEAKNFLWRLDSPQGRQAYIMGSLHLAHAGLYPLNDKIMEAFGQSDFLVVEINSEDMDPALMERFIKDHGYVAGGRPLAERLSEKTSRALKDSGFYQNRMAAMTPWLAALAIQVEVMHKQGFRAEYGLDKYFIDRAKERKIRILELENLDQQMGMLVEMSQEEDDLFLLSTLLEMDDLPKVMTAFLDSWAAGNVDGFAEAFFKEYHKYPELKPLLDIIIFRRNQEMAAKIENLMNEEAGVGFIVIGAGHLISDRSVLAELVGKGWRASQL